MKQRAASVLANVPTRHASIRVRSVPPRVFGRTAGVAAPWGIYVRSDLTDAQLRSVLRHELVHIDQWRRLGVAGFARRYLTEYLAGRRAGRGHRAAYLAISLEREARHHTMTTSARSSSASG